MNIIVIGASSGIGHYVSNYLSKKSLNKVGGLARRKENISVNLDFRESVDVRDLNSLKLAFEEFVKKFGKIDSVIFTAGIQLIKPLKICKDEEIVDVIQTNLIGAIRASKLFLNPKLTTKQSVFIAISSIASFKPDKGIIPYSISKSGIDNLIKGLALESAPRRCFSIQPGWIETEMTSSLSNIYDRNFISELIKNTPADPASLQSISQLISFLISNKSKSMTGQSYTIDGGITLT